MPAPSRATSTSRLCASSSISTTTSRTSNTALRIATRGSKLALAQTEIVAELIRAADPTIEVEVVPVTTTGDRDQRPYAEIGGKGLFMGEVEREVLEGRADIAVHSAKDLTAELADGCTIVCVPTRGPSHDVVVGPSHVSERLLEALEPGSKVGTSSMRRRALLREFRPDLEVVELRGNLDTRLRKVEAGEVDAAILAAAGIERLGVEVTADVLDPDEWIPAPAQGALAIEARQDRADIAALLAPLEDALSRAQVTAERSFAAALEGGCSVPLGCRAVTSHQGDMVVNGYLGHPDGSQVFRDRISGPVADAEMLGRELADAIRSSGGDDLLEELKHEQAPPPQAP